LVRDDVAPPYDGIPSATAHTGTFSMIAHQTTDRLEGDGYAIAVYSVLVRHANKEGVCWPSVAKICKAVGWSKKVVLPAIQRLVDGGFISKEARKLHGMDQSNRYRITAYGRVLPTVTPVVPRVTMGGSHGDSGCHLQKHEVDTPEVDTPEVVTTPLSPDFDVDFWPHYPKGRGSKADARKLWSKLSVADRWAAVESLPSFAAGSDWKRGFHTGPEVWLRGRRWENPPPPYLNGADPSRNGRKGYTSEQLRQMADAEDNGHEPNRDDASVISAQFRVVE
jgi:hypothetical protein